MYTHYRGISTMLVISTSVRASNLGFPQNPVGAKK
jgi:hypothetical protein